MKLFLLTLLLTCTTSSHAFLNIEALRMSKLKENSSRGSFKLGLNSQNGNVNRERYKVSSLNLYKKTKNTWIALADYQYGETFGLEDTRQGRAHLRFTRHLKKSFQSELYSQVQFNKFQNLNSRKIIGGGCRTTNKFFEEKLKGSFGLGAFYESEELENQNNLNNPRGNLYLGMLLTSKIFNFSSTTYYQPNLENMKDYRIHFNLGIETQLGKIIFQQISYSIVKDSRPPKNISRTDGSLLVEVGARY